MRKLHDTIGRGWPGDGRGLPANSCRPVTGKLTANLTARSLEGEETEL